MITMDNPINLIEPSFQDHQNSCFSWKSPRLFPGHPLPSLAIQGGGPVMYISEGQDWMHRMWGHLRCPGLATRRQVGGLGIDHW